VAHVQVGDEGRAERRPGEQPPVPLAAQVGTGVDQHRLMDVA
jgi:hypothetical protein